MLIANFSGFGLTVNPAMYATTGYRPGGTQQMVSTGAAPGYSISQHTLYQVWREQMPPDFGWFSEMGVTPVTMTGGTTDQAVISARADAWRDKVRAAAATLPECPAGSVTDGGASCYYGRAAAGAYQEMADGSIQLMAPGTFHVYGVTFRVDDLKDGRFTKAFKPDATQRKRIEWAVIKRSIGRFFGDRAGRYSGAPPVIGDGMIKDTIMKEIQAGRKQSGWNPSVDEILAIVPDMALYWVNFDRNPIQPTPTERTQPGGWVSWIRKGGYPLSRAVLQSKVSVSDGALGIEFCSSILCRCPTTMGKEPGTGRPMKIGGFPSCVPMGFTKNGVGQEEGSGSFFPFVSVHQGVGDPTFELTLIHDDPSWIEKIGMAGRDWMMKIVDTACSNESINTNAQAKIMCAAWGVGKILQAKENLPSANLMPAPEAPIIPPSMDLPLPAPPQSTASRYAGCVARFNTTRRKFVIYCPMTFAGWGGLGATTDAVTPPPPVGFTRTTELDVLPNEGEQVVGQERDNFFRLDNPWMWAAIAGATAVAGGGGYALYRRKRAA